ncbi:FKBP-type peptidyl-prolyl cis-trans isomerase [Myroides sp. LJL119]
MAKSLSTLLVLIGIISLSSCQEKQPARSAITQNSNSVLGSSIHRNAELTQEQQDLFLQYIQDRPKEKYNHNQKGFYYTYLHRELRDSITAEPGDIVTYSYQISDLQDQTIYSFEQIATQTAQIDKQDLLPIIRQGLKILKQNEVIKILAPSELAYSYLGDTNKISKNQPLIFTIELKSIQK